MSESRSPAKPDAWVFWGFVALLCMAPMLTGTKRPVAWPLFEIGIFALSSLWLALYAFGKAEFSEVFRRSWWPYETVLGRVPGIPGYHDIRSHPDAEHLAGLIIYRFDAPLFFANARTFRDEVCRLARAEPTPRWIIVAAEPITDVDPTAADMLTDLDEGLNAGGTSLVFAEVKDPVRRKIERYQLTRTIDPQHFFPTLEAAVEAFRAETGARWEALTDPTKEAHREHQQG